MKSMRKPWNKGLRFPLSKCERHRTERRRLPCGAVLCDACHREASSAWNRANKGRVDAARDRHRARQKQERD